MRTERSDDMPGNDCQVICKEWCSNVQFAVADEVWSFMISALQQDH